MVGKFRLTRRHELGIAALLEHTTVAAATDACGIPLGTVRRWLRQPLFRERYAAASREALSLTVARIKAATGTALATLEECLGDESGSVRVQAARTILDIATRVDLDDLRQRIERLEQQQEHNPCATSNAA